MKLMMEIDDEGVAQWTVGDQFHRTDGPALEYPNGDKFWMVHNKFHRTDGPAIVRENGNLAWYLDDVYLTFDRWLEQTPGLNDEEKVMLKLRYG
jgi:hypothetical protein|tara:strand:+ start:3577 stop:3858 length:282 start_codon:yes stop_codon:yes gene_type:complete